MKQVKIRKSVKTMETKIRNITLRAVDSIFAYLIISFPPPWNEKTMNTFKDFLPCLVKGAIIQALLSEEQKILLKCFEREDEIIESVLKYTIVIDKLKLGD
jgi:hypothetical protein